MRPAAEGHARLVGLTFGTLFLVLASWIRITGSFPGDDQALTRLHRALGTSIDGPMVFLGNVTDLLPLIAFAVVCVVTFLVMDRRVDAARFAVIVAIVLVANRLLKQLVARPRPDLRAVPDSLSTYSFPSGHAANTAAIVGALLLVARTGASRTTIAVVGGAVVVAVGFSRLAITAHYPTDIAGGWMWVAAWLALLLSVNRSN